MGAFRKIGGILIWPGDFTGKEALLVCFHINGTHFSEFGEEVDEDGWVVAVSISDGNELEDGVESQFTKRAVNLSAPSDDADFGVVGEALVRWEAIAELGFMVSAVLEILRAVAFDGGRFGLRESIGTANPWDHGSFVVFKTSDARCGGYLWCVGS